jgi:uncharacterized membrane protein
MKQLFSLALVVISLLGIFDASYITYEKLSGRIPTCRPPFECGTVLNSEWAYIAGIPLSIFGLVFYTTVFVFAVMNVLEVELTIPLTKNISNTLHLLSMGGFGFSLYLMFLMQFVIKAWCLWCLFSAITSSSLFIGVMLLKFVEKREKLQNDSFNPRT